MAEDQSQGQNRYSSEIQAISAPTADQADHYHLCLRSEIPRMNVHQHCQIWQNPITLEFHWLHHPRCLKTWDQPWSYQTLEWQSRTLEEMYLTARRFAPTADRQTSTFNNPNRSK